MSDVARITAPHGLHLRKNPNAHSEIQATIPFGTVVNVDGRDGNWIKTSYQFKPGYVYKDYVAVSKVPGPDLDPPYPVPAEPTFSYYGIWIVIVGAIAAAFAWWFAYPL